MEQQQTGTPSDSKPRSWILPVSLLVIAVLLIAAAAVYNYYRPIVGGQSPVATATVQPDASPSPGASPGAGVVPTQISEPDLTVDANGLSKATVTITTNEGVIKYKFYPTDAPVTTKRIIELTKQGFYNGLIFHRVVQGFVIQTGDPQGNGTGGSGQRLKAEFNNRRHNEGTVAMARAADPDSADSQFYISLGTHPHLDRSYTVFGQVIEGMDVARKIKIGDKMIKVVVE